MNLRLDILLLLALPASGKSELRRYLDHLDAATARRDMALGPTIQLDDYPYVHLMRRISQELAALNEEPVFFAAPDAPWLQPLDWLTLVHLLNDDYAAAMNGGAGPPTPGGLLDRLGDARRRAGAPPPFAHLSGRRYAALADSIARDVAAMGPVPGADDDSTIVIEFARGGPEGAPLPLHPPLGYASSLAALSDDILDRACILYVWVDPEESRRRNRERARPGIDGDASILHHGVPEAVMHHDYGLDDMEWLSGMARVPGTIPIGPRNVAFQQFDNRVDRTSFLRGDPEQWPPGAVRDLHADLSSTLLRLAERR